MVFLILAAFGCQKEELSTIEATPTTVGEDGSYKGCPLCPVPSLFANPTLLLPDGHCSIPFTSEDNAACIAEDNPYMIELFISNGNLGIFSFKRNPFYAGVTLAQGSVRWQMKNDGNWSDCGSYVFDDFTINSDYLIELEVRNGINAVVASTSFCFNIDENNVVKNCATNEVLNFTCEADPGTPQVQDLPSDPGGTMAIILF